jgi:hypothetical protein
VEWKQQHDHGHPQTSLELYGIRTSLRRAYPAQQPTRSHFRRRPGPTAPHHDRTHRQTGPSLIRTHRTATHPRTSSPMPPDTGHGRFIFLFIYFLLCVSSHSRPRSSSPSLPPSLAIAARTSTPRRPAARSPPPSPHLPPLLYPCASRRNRNEVAVGDGGRVENGSWRDATAARFQPRIQLQPVSDDSSASSFTCVPVPGIAVVIGGVWVRIDWVVLVRARGV